MENKIKAIIFDMDGVLIDSEPFWHKAEIEVFGREGAVLTEQMCTSMQGVKCIDVMKHWTTTFPYLKKTAEEYAIEVEKIVHQLVTTQGKPMPGAIEAVKKFHNKGLKIGLASASKFFQIEDVMNVLGIKQYFDIIHSAEHEKQGKPAPDVFLHTAEKLNVAPSSCLVIEDSANGVLAAKRAKMYVWAVPEPSNRNNIIFNQADRILKSLEEI